MLLDCIEMACMWSGCSHTPLYRNPDIVVLDLQDCGGIRGIAGGWGGGGGGNFTAAP